MLRSIGDFFTHLARRFMPSPFVFAILLTFVVYVAGIGLTDSGPFEMVGYWYDGFWNLLSFSMQMVLILLGGYVLATSPQARSLIARLARLPSTPGQAIVLIAVVTIVAGWMNWGLGLVIGAVMAVTVSESARSRGIRVHFPLAAAAGYAGLLIFGNGFSSSAPLLVNTQDHFLFEEIGLVPVAETILTPYNLITSLVFLAVIPLVLRAMHPALEECREIGPDVANAFEDEEPGGGGEVRGSPSEAEEGGAGMGVREERGAEDGRGVEGGGGMSEGGRSTPEPRTRRAAATLRADLVQRLESTGMISYPIALAGLGFVVWFFATRGLALDLNIVNFTLIMGGMVLYGSPSAYGRAMQKAVTTSTGIILQFPFYAGIMGMMTLSGLVGVFANAIISVSNPVTFPLASMFSAAFVNFFVPSAGGQWAVQGPILVEASQALDVSMGQTIMAFSYGDQLTNMVQPFWAIPLLGITDLDAGDLMGYTAVVMLVALVIFAVGVTVLPLVGLSG